MAVVAMSGANKIGIIRAFTFASCSWLKKLKQEGLPKGPPLLFSTWAHRPIKAKAHRRQQSYGSSE